MPIIHIEIGFGISDSDVAHVFKVHNTTISRKKVFNLLPL